MKNITKLAFAFLGGVVVASVGLWLVGNQSAEQVFGASLGITRYPNSGIAVRCLNVTTSAGTASACTDGTFTASGTNTLSGSTTATGSFTATGAVLVDAFRSGSFTPSPSTTSTAITAAQACDNGGGKWTPTVANATATLPDAVPLQADCGDVAGSSNYFYFENQANAASSTKFVAGASSTIEFMISSTTAASGTTLPGGDTAKIEWLVSTTTTSNSAMVKYFITIFED